MKNYKLDKPSSAYFALSIATAALTLNFWAWSLLGPLGSRYSSELSLSPFMLSFLLAVPVIIGSLGRIILGMLTDRFGGRIMFSLVCLATALSVTGLSFAEGYAQLVFAAFFLGIGGASFVVGVPFVSAWFPPAKRGLIIGLYTLGNAGTALSGFATPRLDDLIGRQGTYLLVAALLVIMAAAFAICGNDAPQWKKPKQSAIKRFTLATRSRITWDMAMTYAVVFGAFVAFGVYLPVLLNVSYGITSTDAATRAAGFVLLVTLARPIGGWISDKIGGKHVVKTSLLLVAGLATFVAFQPTLKLTTTVAYLTMAFVLGCGGGAVFALIGRLSESNIMGSITGIVGACGGLGGFLPPLVLGVTYQQFNSYAPALLMLAVCSFGVFLYVRKRFKDPLYRFKKSR